MSVYQNYNSNSPRQSRLVKLVAQKRLTDALHILEQFGHSNETALAVIRLTQALLGGEA